MPTAAHPLTPRSSTDLSPDCVFGTAAGPLLLMTDEGTRLEKKLLSATHQAVTSRGAGTAVSFIPDQSQHTADANYPSPKDTPRPSPSALIPVGVLVSNRAWQTSSDIRGSLGGSTESQRH